MQNIEPIPVEGSFRDPSGSVFRVGDTFYRRVNGCFAANFELLQSSGLLARLHAARLLVSHEEISGAELHSIPAEFTRGHGESPYKLLKLEEVPFISYPYEWCFAQLKDAALLTLQIQKLALEYGMSLKDASAYNVQFLSGKPIFIDTLSFERYEEGKPWIAYRQFCQHFLAPLLLMAHRDVRLSQLLRVHLDGIPLDLASKLLPRRTWLRFSTLAHVHLHGWSQRRYQKQAGMNVRAPSVSSLGLRALIDSLETAVSRIEWQESKTQWSDYYNETNYSDSALEQKKLLVSRFLHSIKPRVCYDLGANTGVFSSIAAQHGCQVLAFDIDPLAVERHYQFCRKNSQRSVLPLVADLTNPAPGIGWDNLERAALFERGSPDVILALALVHHLSIVANIPLARVARTFHRLLAASSGHLIVEFVPKEDSQVRKLLGTREDIFRDYSTDGFESAFAGSFEIVEKAQIAGTARVLYLLRRK